MSYKKILIGLILFLSLSSVAFAAPILKIGAYGHDVRILQQELEDAGYDVAVSGEFDEATRDAVISFQQDNALDATGIVNRETWHALKKEPAAPVRHQAENENAKKSDDKKSNDSKKEDAPVVNMPKPSGKVPESAPFVPKSKVKNILGTAARYKGVKYVFGGDTPKGFDCSGFVMYVFRQHSFVLPRTSDEQYKFGKKTVDRKGLVPGDLVFFTTYEPGASHVGIYLGDYKFIHVSSSKGVRVDSLDDSYWKPRYYGGKHIVMD
ncbi:MAG: C40 family peptidase [Selenomonadaceae bacterium]